MELRIREIRKAHGMTMKELGQKVGLTESAISLYELGKREPNFDTLMDISKTLGVQISDLFVHQYDFSKPFFAGAPAYVEDSTTPVLDELLNIAQDLSEDQAAALLPLIKAMLK